MPIYQYVERLLPIAQPQAPTDQVESPATNMSDREPERNCVSLKRKTEYSLPYAVARASLHDASLLLSDSLLATIRDNRTQNNHAS